MTAALPMSMTAGEYGFPTLSGVEDSGKTGIDCLSTWLAVQGTVGMPDGDRIQVRGSSEQSIYSRYIPLWAVIPAMLLIGIVQYKLRVRDREDEF